MKVKSFNPAQKININHRKENKFVSSFLAFAAKEEKVITAVDIRIYETASTAYACVWIKLQNEQAHGSGSTGGGGYHKASAAVAIALDKAGVKLTEDIDGRGDEAIREAAEAIAKHLYPDYFVFVHKAHA